MEMKEVYNKYAKQVCKGVPFSRYMYKDKQPEVVNSIPHDIEVFKYYLEKTNNDEWNEKQRDSDTLLWVQQLEKVFMARGKLDDVPTIMSVPLICVQQK